MKGEASKKGHVMILGLSSGIGRHVAKALLARRFFVSGTYRSESHGAELEKELPDVALSRVDVRNRRRLRLTLKRWLRGISLGERCACIVSVGAWRCGKIWSYGQRDVDSLAQINLLGALEAVRCIFAERRDNCHVIVLLPLAGARNAISENVVGAACGSALYAMIQATGAELIATNCTIVGVAIGIFDIGQAYLSRMLQESSGVVAVESTRLCTLLTDLSTGRYGRILNGGVVEATGGMENYAGVVRWLKDNRGKMTCT